MVSRISEPSTVKLHAWLTIGMSYHSLKQPAPEIHGAWVWGEST